MPWRLPGFCGDGLVGRMRSRNTWNHPQYYPVDCSIWLDNSSGIVIAGFHLKDPQLKEAAICIGKNCDPGTNGILMKNLSVEISLTVPVVRDGRPATATRASGVQE